MRRNWNGFYRLLQMSWRAAAAQHLTKPHLLQFLSAISEHAAEELAAVYSEKEIVGGNQHHGNLIA